MNQIKAITEAHSQQPHYFGVCCVQHEHHSHCIEKIVVETMRVDSDKQCDFYVGYYFDGQRAFEFLRSSVNVIYKPNPLTESR